MLIGEGTGSTQAQSSRQKKELFLVHTFSFQPKLQRLAHLIPEIVKEKISKLELLPCNGRFFMEKESSTNEIS